MVPLSDFSGNPHRRHAGKLVVRPFDGLTKTLSRFEAGVLCQVDVMDDEILPRGGALYDPRHALWRLTTAQDFQALALHGVELVLGDFDVGAALLGLIE